MADIDHFKAINDTYGHQAGDAVLRGVGAMISEMVRSTDVAGRYGGEEFVLIQPQNAIDGAEVLAGRIREAVEAASFLEPGGSEIKVTMSLGVAEYRSEMTSPEDLVGAADHALYAAKDRGRNRVILDESR
jgi:diguanylate cyclase (GGDEF)-like protein